MNATSLYVSTSRLVFQNDGGDHSWTDLYRLVPYLRQALCCSVCANLLRIPFTPINTHCQHHVCKQCIGGRKSLKPSCNWCRDYSKYEENVQLRILLQCYKSLCEHILSIPIFNSIQHQSKTIGSVANGANAAGSTSLIEFIEEGAGFKDDFKCNSGLTKSAYSILPCVYTNSSTQTTHNSTIASSVSSSIHLPGIAPTPVVDKDDQHHQHHHHQHHHHHHSHHQHYSVKPEKSEPAHHLSSSTSTTTTSPQKTSNGSAIYSVMYAGSGNKITIKRKTDIDEEPPTSESNLSNNFKKPSSSRSKPTSKRKGCRCGNATPTPGKLTCCGQRCPCYVDSKSCIDCKCRGCRNPHRPDGYKVRPHIPSLENFGLQMTTAPLQTQQESCIELSMDAYGDATVDSCVSLDSRQVSMGNSAIVYDNEPLSHDKIQVFPVVYTTHNLSEVSTTLPTNILMDDSEHMNFDNEITSPASMQAHVFNEEIINSQSSISEECSSDEKSDIDIV